MGLQPRKARMVPGTRRDSALLWVALAALVGFAIAATFSSWLRWDRARFVLAHASVTLLFFAVYIAKTAIRPLVQLRRRWLAGLVVGLVGGAALAYGVQGQVPSSQPVGTALVGALVWLGLVYGAMDALLLTVVPVLSVYGSRDPETLRSTATRVRWGRSRYLPAWPLRLPIILVSPSFEVQVWSSP